MAACRDSMQDGDAVAIFNFRADRVVEISKAFEYKDFDKFDRKRYPDVSMPPLLSLCFCTSCGCAVERQHAFRVTQHQTCPTLKCPCGE